MQISTQDSLNDHKISYIAGNNLVIMKNEHQQLVIPGTEGTLYIQNYTVSSSKKFLAIAEKTTETGIITIYELKRQNDLKLKKKRTILSRECQTLTYEFLEFLPSNEKYLITLTEGPNYKLILWEWEKGKMKTMIEIQHFQKINGMFIADKNDNLLFCYGKPEGKISQIRSFIIKIENEGCQFLQKYDIVKDFLKNYNRNFTVHNFVEENLIAFGNEESEIIFLNKQYEIKSKIVLDIQPQEPLQHIFNWQKGFFVSTSKMKLIYFKKNEMDIKNPYSNSSQIFSYKDYEDKGIISVLSSKENIKLGLDNGELITLSFSKTNLDFQNPEIKPLTFGLHKGTINDIDICKKKPLIATCGQDGTIKIWNYLEFVQEYSLNLNKNINSISFHPSGLHIVVSLMERIKLINLNIDSLKVFKEFSISNSKLVRFSNGGQYIAYATKENTIQLINFYTLKIIPMDFQKHENSITNLFWAQDDLSLYSSCAQGRIVHWKLSEKGGEFIENEGQKPFNSLVITQNQQNSRNYMVTSLLTNEIQITFLIKNEMEEKDQKGTQLEKIGNEKIEKEIKIIQLQEQISSVLISGSMKYLIMALGDLISSDTMEIKNQRGAILLTRLPELKEFIEINCNLVGIKKICINQKDNVLFSIGFDNSICIIDLKDEEYACKKEGQIEGEGINVKEEYLYDELILAKQIEEIEILNNKLTNNEKSQEQKIQKKNQEKETTIKMLEQQMKDLEQEREKIERIKDEEIKFEQLEFEKKKNLYNQKHQEQKQKIIFIQKQKMQLEKEKFQKLKEENVQMKVDFDQQIEKLQTDYQELSQEIETKYENELQNLDEFKEEQIKLKREIKAFYDGKILDIEEELDQDIEKMKINYEKDKNKINQERNEREKEVNDCRKRFNSKDAEKKLQEKKQLDIEEELKNLNKQIEERKEQYQQITENLKDKKQTIEQKIERINEISTKKSELQKTKQAFDMEIKQLKQKKGPREEDIAKMNQQLHNMQIEIQQFIKSNSNMMLDVKVNNLKLQGLSNHQIKNQKFYKEKKTFLENFENHISEMISNYMDNYKELKKKLLFLYNNYVLNEDKFVEENVDKKKAYSEQRAYLESCIKTLKEKFMKNIQVHKNDNKRIMKENVDLINAINELKRERKFKQDNKKKIENLKEEIKREINIATAIHKNKQEIKKLEKELEKQMKVENEINQFKSPIN